MNLGDSANTMVYQPLLERITHAKLYDSDLMEYFADELLDFRSLEHIQREDQRRALWPKSHTKTNNRRRNEPIMASSNNCHQTPSYGSSDSSFS